MRVLALMVLVGCSDDDGDGVGPSAAGPEEWAPAIALGSGDTAFEPLSDGDPLTIWKGPQGPDAYHANVGGEVTGMSAEVAIHPLLTLVSTGTVLAGVQQPQYLALAGFDEADCTGFFWGVRAFVDDAEPGGDYSEFICSLVGELVELSVEVENLATGEAVSESVELEITLSPEAVAVCP